MVHAGTHTLASLLDKAFAAKLVAKGLDEVRTVFGMVGGGEFWGMGWGAKISTNEP